MEPIRILYRDVDRTPWLYTLKHAAAQHGLAIEIAPAGREYGELLDGASALVLAESYHALQALRARGAPLVCLATSITWLNEQLFVGPGITSIQDLRGKRFALRGIPSSEMIERLWLKDHGLEGLVEVAVFDDQEVGRWRQWTKVLDGSCHGCLVTNLYADAPADAGLETLPFERFGYLGNVTLTTHRSTVERDRGAAEALVRAAFDATRLFKTEPATVMAILEKDLPEPLQVTGLSWERTYQILHEELPDYPVPSLEGLANMRRMAMGHSPELVDFNPLLFWDLSFATRIVDERGGAQPG